MALAFVHKAAAIQSQPKMVLSMRPRLTLLPLEAGTLTVRYRYLQGWLHGLQDSNLQGAVKVFGILRKPQRVIGSYGSTTHAGLVRIMPSAVVRPRRTVLLTG